MSLPAQQAPDLNEWLARLDASDGTLRQDVLDTLHTGPLWDTLTRSTSFTYPSEKERLWRALRPLDDPRIWAGFRNHVLANRMDSSDSLVIEIQLKAHAPLAWSRWLEILPALKAECRMHAGKDNSAIGGWFADIIWGEGFLPPVVTTLDRQAQATFLYAFLVDLDGGARVRANLAKYRDEPIVDIARRILPAVDPWRHCLDLLGISDALFVETLRAQVEALPLQIELPEGIEFYA